jgi:hypothetical protein
MTYDPDIGACDDCGSESGARTPVERGVRVAGVLTRVRVWLCEDCKTKNPARDELAGFDHRKDEFR